MITRRKLRNFFQSKVVVADKDVFADGAFVHSLDQY